jgi:NAD(P)-dependent dehydrogenase (short-subunit alcohol dehydrogenase family)
MVPYVLVTGASSGIGRAIAVRLGADRPVLLSGRNDRGLQETAEACASGTLLWPRDLSSTDTLAVDLAVFLREHHASVDALVHCAGVDPILPLRLLEPAVVIETMNVNVLSAVQILRTLGRKSTNASGLASVVFISSTFAERGGRGQALYGASKAALHGLARSLAVELAPNTRVNVVLAGGVKTPMSQRVFDDPALMSTELTKYPLGLGEPESIADMAAFLLSRQAAWVTGQVLTVDGGRSLL